MQETLDERLALSHSQLLGVIFGLFKARRLERKSLLRSRFKNLQKAGLPRRSRPTRGSHQKYQFNQVCEFVLAFELSEFGLAPKAIFDSFYVDVENSFAADLLHKECLHREESMDGDALLAFSPNAISASSEYFAFEYLPIYSIKEEVAYYATRSRRVCCINLTRLANSMLRHYPEKNLADAGITKPQQLAGFS